MKVRFVFCVICFALTQCVNQAFASEKSYDLIVYGGTPAGVTSAIAGRRQGLEVLVIAPENFIGGMVSSGVSDTDISRAHSVGGLTKEYFRRLGKYYGEDIAWKHEPHVAEAEFNKWLAEEKVEVVFDRLESVIKNSENKITEIHLVSNKKYSGKVFIDATYVGDLMAKAGASYRIGREATSEFNEKHAGVLAYSGRHNWAKILPAFDKWGRLHRGISRTEPGELGQADHKVVAYNYRLCFSKDDDNKAPFAKPENYRELHDEYEILEFHFQHHPEAQLGDLMRFDSIPNGKFDINSRGPISLNYIGRNWEYPDADYQRRKEIEKEHKNYIMGLLYYLSHDKNVPGHIKMGLRSYGHCKDEYVKNENWPYQLYVREARRLVGDFILTERHVVQPWRVNDSIGFGAWYVESHNVQRFVNEKGMVVNEGRLHVDTHHLYQIPYGVLLPKKTEVTNLLVPVCHSATHVAYSATRVEPTYMILGEASGVASKLAIESKKNVQDIDVEKLQKILLDQGHVLKLEQVQARK